MRHYLVSYRNGQLHHEEQKPDYLSALCVISAGAAMITLIMII